ncbi:MAG: ABC transporter permease [Verrucomicrobiales bacterium]|nr:ABC transporter permease [Verrucomicrobiales bacterium]MCP5526961.1 ABC transporter permease [Verrucomicrobiales bacterium]
MNLLLRRLVWMPPLLLVISLLAFCLVRLAPGGPFDRERKPASPEIERALQERYHLDEPWWRQYLRFLGGLARGDLGASLKYRSHTVTDIIRQGLPASLAIGGGAFLLALGLGVPAGFYSAVRRGRWEDFGVSFLILLAVCIPAFVVGPLLAMVFAVRLGWLPVGLWGSPLHAVLPVVSLGLYFAGRIARLTREGMFETAQQDFIRTARAKGLPETAVLVRHALPLALLPVASYSGPMLADLLTGSFVVENLFQIPGIGVFMVNSSLNRDYTMVVGLVLLYAGLLLGLNLLVDLLYGWLDPRTRHG